MEKSKKEAPRLAELGITVVWLPPAFKGTNGIYSIGYDVYDIEFRNPSVREELKRWGEWYWKETGFDGVRLDAVKHIIPAFENQWLDHMRKITGISI